MELDYMLIQQIKNFMIFVLGGTVGILITGIIASLIIARVKKSHHLEDYAVLLIKKNGKNSIYYDDSSWATIFYAGIRIVLWFVFKRDDKMLKIKDERRVSRTVIIIITIISLFVALAVYSIIFIDYPKGYVPPSEPHIQFDIKTPNK